MDVIINWTGRAGYYIGAEYERTLVPNSTALHQTVPLSSRHRWEIEKSGSTWIGIDRTHKHRMIHGKTKRSVQQQCKELSAQDHS